MEKGGQKIFREEAVERLSSPEQLDQSLQIVDRQAWLPLATAGTLLVLAAIWSVFGRIPVTVSGQGLLLNPRRVIQFQAPSSGRLLALNVQPGDEVTKGQVLGIIDQSAVRQLLQQEQNKLIDLMRQNQDITLLDKNRIALERDNLNRQRADLERRLKRELQTPIVEREKTLQLLERNRADINLQLQQIRDLLPRLKKRRETRERLLERGVISEDVLLAAEQEYLNNLVQVAQLQTQLQELELKKIDLEKFYLETLSNIEQLKTQIDNIKTEQAKLAQQELELSLDKTNKIREVKRRIAQLEKELADKSQIISHYDGLVLEVAIVPGTVISEGKHLGAIKAEETSGQLVSVAYFADRDGKKIQPGMTIQVTPSLTKRERYGGIVGEVIEVAPFPVTIQDMSVIIGNNEIASNLAQTIQASGGKAAVQVFARLKPEPDNISGYKWSSSDGPPLKITPGTTTEVRVKVEEKAPISYLIPILRSLTGIY